MARARCVLSAAVFPLVCAVGCSDGGGGDGDSRAIGAELGPCRDDGGCDAPLICGSGLCVRPGSSGASTASPPIPPPPQGAYAILIQPAGTCAVAPPEFSLGEDAFALRRNGGTGRVTDADDGADVSCRVAGSDTFELEGRIVVARQGNLTVRGQVDRGSGTAAITEWNAHSQGNLSSEDCSITVRYVAKGAIWAEFSCPDFSGNLPNTRGCTADGVFVLENCTQD